MITRKKSFEEDLLKIEPSFHPQNTNQAEDAIDSKKKVKTWNTGAS